MTDDRLIDERLAVAGVVPGTAPVDAWRRLQQVEGRRATVIDLYELAARDRGLAAHQLPLSERIFLARSVMPDVRPGWAVTSGRERTGDLIEHVGSTAVPGLAAKPITDVQVSVADLDDETAYVPPIEGIGLLADATA